MAEPYHQIRTAPDGPPAGCPVDHRFSPLAEAYLADPYPIADELRERAPVVYAEPFGVVVVSRMEDVEAVFMHPEVYSSANVQDPVFPIHPDAAQVLADGDFGPIAVMSNRQPPDHGRIRQFTTKGFSTRRSKTLEPYIRRRTNELLDDMLAAGSPADFIAHVAQPLPGEVIFRFIGFPEADDERLKAWCDNRLAFTWGRSNAEQQVEIAHKLVAYWHYVRDFTAAKRNDPGDDFASELLADHAANPDLLSYREVESILYGLSFAGHEPVTLLLGNALRDLLPRRDVWRSLCADPARIPAALEEVIRWDSPQIGWRRVTNRDTTLAGVDLPAGTQIFLNLAAANHDPRRFADPDAFDVERPDARANISFGKGIHHCLGAKFARVEATVVLEVLAERLPALEVVPDQPVRPFPNISFRGPSELLVQWPG